MQIKTTMRDDSTPTTAAAAAAKSLQSCPTLCDPHRRQPTRLPRPWDSPGKNTGVCCHFLLQCMKVKSESEVTQSCSTLSDPMDCSLPGSSPHGIFQARGLEWGAIAFSATPTDYCKKKKKQVLTMIWRNWNPFVLLVGMSNGTTSVRNIKVLPQKIKKGITIWSSNSTSRHIPKRTESRVLKIYLTPIFTAAIIHNSQKVEATQRSIDIWMNKQNVIYTHEGILFSL